MQWLWTCALLVALTDTGNGLARNNLGKYPQLLFFLPFNRCSFFEHLPFLFCTESGAACIGYETIQQRKLVFESGRRASDNRVGLSAGSCR